MHFIFVARQLDQPLMRYGQNCETLKKALLLCRNYTLYLLADFLLQYVTLFQSRDIVKNLVSL